MKASTIVLVIAAPILAAVAGTHAGKALARDVTWSDSVDTKIEFCRYEQAEFTETDCLLLLGAMI